MTNHLRFLAGEELDTREKLVLELSAFLHYTRWVAHGKARVQAIPEFAKTRSWGQGEGPKASDLRALEWFYFSACEGGIPRRLYLEKYWQTREGKLELIALNVQKQRGKGSPIPPPQQNLIEICLQERESALDQLSAVTCFKELQTWGEDFIKAQKQLLRAFGLRPCKSVDCSKYIESPNPRKEFCSDACGNRQNRRNRRKNNPTATRMERARTDLGELFHEDPALVVKTVSGARSDFDSHNAKMKKTPKSKKPTKPRKG